MRGPASRQGEGGEERASAEAVPAAAEMFAGALFCWSKLTKHICGFFLIGQRRVY